jgi:hypothetical protein
MGGDEKCPVWLPIDAKFPMEDYQRLIEAQERADPLAVELAAKALELLYFRHGRMPFVFCGAEVSSDRLLDSRGVPPWVKGQGPKSVEDPLGGGGLNSWNRRLTRGSGASEANQRAGTCRKR